MLKRLVGLAAVVPALAIAASGVFTPLWTVAATRAENSGGEDAYLRALEPARGAVAEEVIGFLSQHPVDGSGGGSAELFYYLAQYGLAPVLVESGPDRRLVLVADPRPGRVEELVTRPGRSLFLELAPGLAIIESRPRVP